MMYLCSKTELMDFFRKGGISAYWIDDSKTMLLCYKPEEVKVIK